MFIVIVKSRCHDEESYNYESSDENLLSSSHSMICIAYNNAFYLVQLHTFTTGSI